MALIDEYKQAIQDVLDGRALAAPKPSELPWTEDKLASMWAAAAAELIAEANAGGSSGGGVLVVHMDENSALDKTWSEINTAAQTGPVILYDAPAVYYLVSISGGEGEYIAAFFGSYGVGLMETVTDSDSGYPVAI